MGLVIADIRGLGRVIARNRQWKNNDVRIVKYLNSFFGFEELDSQEDQPEVLQMEEVLKVHEGKIVRIRRNKEVPQIEGRVY